MTEIPHNLVEAEIINVRFESLLAEASIDLRVVWEAITIRIELFGVALFAVADSAEQNIVEELVLGELDMLLNFADGHRKLSKWGIEQVEGYLRLIGVKESPKLLLEIQPIFGANILVIFENYTVESEA